MNARTTQLSRGPMLRRAWGGLFALLMLLLPLWAQAQAAPGLPEADQQAIRTYTLNEDVFNRLVATTKEGKAMGIKSQQAGDPSQIHTLDDLVKQAMSGDKRIEPLVAKHGFTPREFLLANIALMNAGIAVQAKTQPELARYVDQNKINKANVAFYESHQSQIAALMQAGDESAGGDK